MAQDLTELTTEIERNSTIDGSAIVLINGIAARIDKAVAAAAAGDTAALTALASSLRSSSTALAEAVAANTPAEEPPTPT